MIDPHEALDRTVRLSGDIDPTLTARQIVSGLTMTNALMRADPTSCRSPAGQTAVITTAILTTQLGTRLQLELPDVPVLECQPPLPPGGSLPERLEKHLAKLITPPGPAQGPIDIELLLGDARSGRPTSLAVRLIGDGWGYNSTIDSSSGGTSWRGDEPLGGIMAAAAAAAEVYRASLRKLRDRYALTYRGAHHLRAHSSEVRVSPLSLPIDFGRVDMISAGAINQATLYTLARMPAAAGDVRVIEHDLFGVSNLNRYPLSCCDDLGVPSARSRVAQARHC